MNTNTNISPGKPLLATNLDTNFLKLIAIISMLIDHMGGVFFPEYPVFRWFGRLAFPIFCYCMTVGMLYTKNIRRYLGRLGLFAIISQPFWILAFNPQDILGNLTNWNIFFTLFISLLSVWGFKEKKWWLFILAFLVIALWNFDYSYTGIILMLIFYLCRRKPVLGACLYALTYLPALFMASPGDPLNLVLGGHNIGFEAGALLALPLIFLHTNTSLKIPKWFFYVFYPAHLGLIALVRYLLGF
nr:TraX family protein [uncultured Eisenbergiella sp.]